MNTPVSAAAPTIASVIQAPVATVIQAPATPVPATQAAAAPTGAPADPAAPVKIVYGGHFPLSETPTQDGPEGIRFDFNDGARVVLPERAEGQSNWRIRLTLRAEGEPDKTRTPNMADAGAFWMSLVR